MDINAALDEIIFKYHLDRCYPHYRDKVEAEKILRNVINTIVKTGRKTLFIGNDKTGIEFIRNISREAACIFLKVYDSDGILSSQFEEINWEEYEAVYLVSFSGAEYAEDWLRRHSIQYNWIYDVFEWEGVFLQRDFFLLGKEDLFSVICKDGIHTRNGITESVQCELFCQQSKYENSRDLRTKGIALEKCLFLSLYMRNFILAKKYIQLLSRENKKYEEVWEEILELLKCIQDTMNENMHENIVLYWLDAIPYGDEKDMPYLRSIMQESVVFENAFAYIANTHPVLREMFLGKHDTDDETYNITEITDDNSPLICFLKEQGYDIKIISGYFCNNFPYKYVSEQFYIDWYIPSSMVLWDMLCNMFRQKQKTLYIIHAMDAHYPYLSSKLEKSNYLNKNIRYKLARQELDEQLAFYDTFVDKNMLHIYMSDHGNTGVRRHHVLFNIYSKKLQAKKISDFFSFTDFGTVLKQIIMHGVIKDDEFVKKYVEIGRFDRYSSREIGNILKIKKGLPLEFVGYKGIIDEEYAYIYYNTGKEWIQRRDNIPLCDPMLFYECSSDICAPAQLPHYRDLLTEYPRELIGKEKFRYSRYLYKLYHNILQHNNMPERVEVINQMLNKYADGSVAIRMGGVTSVMLYYILSENNRRKIWGFIDNDEDCLCRGIQLPIISLKKISDMPDLGVKAVILPSYTHIKMLREECQGYPDRIDVLDIYDAFDKNGIRCQEDFYKMRGTDEDYDVGFPFEEITK